MKYNSNLREVSYWVISIDVNILLFKLCDAIEYQFLSHTRTITNSAEKYNWGPKNCIQIDYEKITLIFYHPKFSLATTQAGKRYWCKKKMHINCGSKMDVYCMNWVSLNRRLLDVQ